MYFSRRMCGIGRPASFSSAKASSTMVDVGAVTGIDNVGAAYAEREKLMHQAARLCRNPAVALVHFVPDSTVTVQPLDTVAAR